MGSNFIVGLVLLFAGTFVAVVMLKGESRAQTAQIVPLPQIGGGALRRGPWPSCLGISGTECETLIQSNAPDAITEIILPGADAVNPFSTSRVKIYVDDDGIVIMPIPQRG